MTDYNNATARLKALAHPVRLQILAMLRSGDEVCVCHMEAALGKRQAYISQQLMTLRDAGLVETRKEGLSVYYRLIDPVAVDVLDAVLGPAVDVGPDVLDACPCPRCAEVVSEAAS